LVIGDTGLRLPRHHFGDCSQAGVTPIPVYCKSNGMDYFNYKDGRLFAENVDVHRIADEIGTPVYIYSKATFLGHLQKIQKAYSELDTTICYSVKGCGNINILQFMA
jgi:hypothetical protein